MALLRSMTVLQVSDVTASVAFYDRLGFDSHGIWRDRGVASFAIVQRDAVTIALQRADDGLRINSHWAAYLYVTDIERIHAEFRQLDLPGQTEICRDTPYGCDDFEIVDPDGHRIAFGQDMNPAVGPGLSQPATGEEGGK